MIYIIVILLLIILALIFDLYPHKYQSKNNKISDFIYWTVCIIFILIAGFRWKVGGDSLSYQDFFEWRTPYIYQLNLSELLSFKWEPFFILLLSLCKSIVKEFWFFQIVHATFLNIVIFNFIRNNTKLKFISVLIYFCFFYFYFNMEILRESIAICIFIIAYPYYYWGKWKKYYILSLVAILFHNSAIILLFFPFFKNVNINNKSIIKLFLISYSFLLIIDGIKYSDNFIFLNIFERYNQYIWIEKSIRTKIIDLCIYFIFPFLAYSIISRRINHIIFKELFFNYFIISLFYFFNPGFSRFINYFTPFILIISINIIKYIYHINNKYIYKYIILIIVLASPVINKYNYYFRSTSHIYQNTININRWYPYSSIFTKEEYPFREILYKGSLNTDTYRLN